MQSEVEASGYNNQMLCMYLLVILFIFNRREVYRILQEEGIDLPRYAVLNRDPDKPDGQSASAVVIFD